jgi:NAD(P)-dependent dehydrogenase (short-subunit alcohol dehydrogenase family)
MTTDGPNRGSMQTDTAYLPLAGRRIVVSGAASGIGAAAVAAFTDAGADVVGTYHSTPPPDDLRQRAGWVQCDVRDRASVDRALDEAVGILGGIDVLLHAAGIWQSARPETLTEEDLDFVLDTNFRSTVLMNQAAFLRMKGGEDCRILNLGSGEAVRGNPSAPHYAAAKAAVQAWTRSAAAAWGRDGVTVNALSPAVKTAGLDRMRDQLGERAEAFLASVRATMPLRGDLGDPYEDLGPVMVFMAGPGSRYMTGQLIAVNGGMQMVGA